MKYDFLKGAKMSFIIVDKLGNYHLLPDKIELRKQKIKNIYGNNYN